jgi:hypothetical protein
MRHLLPVGRAVAVLAGVGVMAGCSDGPKRIAGPSPTPGAPGPTAPPAVVNVEISGPTSIRPGQSAQFSAILRFSDGTTQTAPSVRWSSQNRVIRVDASGLVTAREENGEDVLSAEVISGGPGLGQRSSRAILVLPDGTYRMVGLVTEHGLPTSPVVGARVEVTAGMPVVAATDYDGRYRLYGIPPTAEIRVTRDGYQPHVQSVHLTEHATQNFELTLAGARLDLAGPYTLTIDIACATSTPVPADVRQRRYAAFLTQSGPTVDVVLTESSRFRINSAGRGNRFSGHVDAAGATFRLDDFLTDSVWYFAIPYEPSAYPSVVEQLSSGTILIMSGATVTRQAADGLSGDLAGSVYHFDSRFLTVPLLSSIRGSCFATSPAHRFTLTRR